jgi:phosphoribosylaminoimidazole-succinocarboxamide synthase
MVNSPAIFQTELLGAALVRRGKVRDIYDLGSELLIVSTDRLSAFDYVLPDPIPDKGRVLTQLSEFWFRRLVHLVPHHLVTTRVDEFPVAVRAEAVELRGRASLVRKLAMLEVECVARGYLAGSGWKEYLASGTVCGIPLPPGLTESARLPEPIFTPATKSHDGHDENIPYTVVESMLGSARAAELRDLTLRLYEAAAEVAAEHGIIIADTKFEFGLDEGRVVLADEALTPDSSRFWPAEDYRPGRVQASYDKQFVRDYLESVAWNKLPPVPALPDDVIEGTRRRYLEIHTILTGTTLD